jgi:hypothetical protein
MQKDKLFAKIGELTVQFATLEHQLQSLLELLVAENSQMIGPFRSPLGTSYKATALSWSSSKGRSSASRPRAT